MSEEVFGTEDMNEETQIVKNKKSSGKFIIGILILIILGLFIYLKVSKFFVDDSPNKYITVLTHYYQAVSRNETNSLQLLTTDSFFDSKLPTFKSGQYDIFIYQISDYTSIENTNSFTADKEIFYSLSVNSSTPSISYINKAYLINVGTEAQLVYISNIYQGQSYLN